MGTIIYYYFFRTISINIATVNGLMFRNPSFSKRGVILVSHEPILLFDKLRIVKRKL